MPDVLLLKIDAIQGESQMDGYANQIELLSYSHGVAMQVTSDISNTERTSGKPNHQDFTVSKYLDASSPLLNQYCCEGKTLGQIVITCARNDAGTVYPLITYTLEDTVVSSVSSSSGGGDKPTETVTLNYTKIKWEYKSQKSDVGQNGTVGTTWDLKTNKSS
jgi:type VI secretion system secreted protein Hcp